MEQNGTSMAIQSPSVEHGTSRYPSIASRNEPLNTQRVMLKQQIEIPMSSSPPLPPGSGHPILSTVANGNRRSRPQTSHQRAVDENRKMHIDHILHRQMQSQQVEIRREKRRNSSTFGMMVMNRLKDLPDMYDTDDENSYGPGGLVSNHSDRNQIDDYGEEAHRYRKIIDRAIRRLDRDENGGSVRRLGERYEQNIDHPRIYSTGQSRRQHYTQRSISDYGEHQGTRRGKADIVEEHLDDLDLDLLGENRDNDQEDDSGLGDSDGDDVITEDEGPT